MISRNSRITQKEFKTFFSKGYSVKTPLFTLLWGSFLNELKTPTAKYSIVVPKSVSKKATDRNKIKRRIASILRKNKNLLKNGVFYIFLTKKPIHNTTYLKIEESVSSSLKQIN